MLRHGSHAPQFLLETLNLAVAGRIAGIVICAGGVCRFFDWKFFASPISVVAGVGVSSAMGLFFGFQPTYRARRLDPIVVLQEK